MRKEDLHNIPDFTKLYADQRFQTLLLYLKTEMPKQDSNDDLSGDWYRGMHSTIRTIEALQIPPNAPPEKQEGIRPLYQSTLHPQNRAL